MKNNNKETESSERAEKKDDSSLKRSLLKDYYDSLKEHTVLGLIEEIEVIGPEGESKKVIARIDSGATKSSIDIGLASELRLGPVVASKIVKSANGAKLRPMVDVKIRICDREVTGHYTLADRSHMKYKVLIGQNILKKDFIIYPNKYDSEEISAINKAYSVKED